MNYWLTKKLEAVASSFLNFRQPELVSGSHNGMEFF